MKLTWRAGCNMTACLCAFKLTVHAQGQDNKLYSYSLQQHKNSTNSSSSQTATAYKNNMGNFLTQSIVAGSIPLILFIRPRHYRWLFTLFQLSFSNSAAGTPQSTKLQRLVHDLALVDIAVAWLVLRRRTWHKQAVCRQQRKVWLCANFYHMLHSEKLGLGQV